MKAQYSAFSIIFILSSKAMEKFSKTLPPAMETTLSSLFNGFWLGVLNETVLQHIVDSGYSRSRLYCSREHNAQGLFSWEEQSFEKYFSQCSNILVAGAGGGREVFALRKKGYYADGFDCNANLVKTGNAFLKEAGFPPSLRYIPSVYSLICHKKYDGIIVGWDAYVHINSNKKRILFLKKLRECLKEGCPVMLSFWEKEKADKRYLKTLCFVANVFRKLLCRELVDLGDDITSRGFAHYFDKDEIFFEFEKSGFRILEYSDEGHYHAIGEAC